MSKYSAILELNQAIEPETIRIPHQTTPLIPPSSFLWEPPGWGIGSPNDGTSIES